MTYRASKTIQIDAPHIKRGFKIHEMGTDGRPICGTGARFSVKAWQTETIVSSGLVDCENCAKANQPVRTAPATTKPTSKPTSDWQRMMQRKS